MVYGLFGQPQKDLKHLDSESIEEKTDTIGELRKEARTTESFFDVMSIVTQNYCKPCLQDPISSATFCPASIISIPEICQEGFR